LIRVLFLGFFLSIKSVKKEIYPFNSLSWEERDSSFDQSFLPTHSGIERGDTRFHQPARVNEQESHRVDPPQNRPVPGILFHPGGIGCLEEPFVVEGIVEAERMIEERMVVEDRMFEDRIVED